MRYRCSTTVASEPPAILQSMFADHDADADRDASSPPLSHQISNAGGNNFSARRSTEWFVFDVQPFLRANVCMSKQVLARTGRTSLSQAKKNPRWFPAGGSIRSWSDELDYQLR